MTPIRDHNEGPQSGTTLRDPNWGPNSGTTVRDPPQRPQRGSQKVLWTTYKRTPINKRFQLRIQSGTTKWELQSGTARRDHKMSPIGDSRRNPNRELQSETLIRDPKKDHNNLLPNQESQAMDSNRGHGDPNRSWESQKLLRTPKCPKLGSNLGSDIPKGDPNRSHAETPRGLQRGIQTGTPIQ